MSVAVRLGPVRTSYLNIVDVVAVPCGTEKLVTESENENILDHLFAEIVVDTEDFLFTPVWCKSVLEFSGRAKVLAERLLNLRIPYVNKAHDTSISGVTYNDSGDAVLRVTVLLQVLRNRNEDTRGKGHVEDTVGLVATLLKLGEVRFELLKAFVLVVLARDVAAHAAELLELLFHFLGGGFDV